MSNKKEKHQLKTKQQFIYIVNIGDEKTSVM